MAGSSGLGDDLGTMKNIDIKSLIIGALLTSTIFLGVAAVVPSGTVPKYQVTSAADGHGHFIVTRMENTTGKVEHIRFGWSTGDDKTQF
jgi:hypothetical protein